MYKLFFIILSLISFSFGHTIFAKTTDLDGDGILDHEDSEVVVSFDQELPAGEYIFQDLIITNNAVLKLLGDQDSPNDFKGVKISANNISVDSGSKISADEQGCKINCLGDSGGYGGAGYGGYGGRGKLEPSFGGSTYGSAVNPTDLGSGNGYWRGGGAIYLEVSSTLTNNGIVGASGEKYSMSGGSILVHTNNLHGNGVFRADGYSGIYRAAGTGGGGGGRIAIYYQHSLYEGSAFVSGGPHGFGSYDGEGGTVGFIDTTNNDLYIYETWKFQTEDSPFNFNNIILLDGASVVVEDNVKINSNILSLGEESSFTILGESTINISTINVGGKSTLTFSGEENLTIKTITISEGSVVTVAPEKILLLELENLTINPTAKLSVNGKGYKEGPGFDINGAGSSYGGRGASRYPKYGGVYISKPVYGSATEPTDFGSGNSTWRGGGAMKLIVSNTLVVDGLITAGGISEMYSRRTSGGSVYILTNNIIGSGNIWARGNAGDNFPNRFGGGGGGRIAVYYKNSGFNGLINVLGGDDSGASRAGGEGTAVFEQQLDEMSLIYSDECGYDDLDINNASFGVHPDKGIADKDELTFKVVYTHTGNLPPEDISLVVENTPSFENEYYKEHFTFADEDLNKLVFEKREDPATSIKQTFIGFDNGIFDLVQGFDKGDETSIFFKHEDTVAATTTFVVKNQGITTPNTFVVVRLDSLDSSNNIITSTTREVLLGVGENNILFSVPVEVNSSTDHVGISVVDSNNTEVWLKGITVKRRIGMAPENLSPSNFASGEQYFISSTFPKGNYSYKFTAVLDGEQTTFPEEKLSFSTGFSSVAFLHGHQGSELYQQSICGTGLCLEKRWPPSIDELWRFDVQALFLNPDGTSQNDILVGDIIKEQWTISTLKGFGGENVYKKFLMSLDDMKKDAVINDWKGINYDWRFRLEDILNNEVRLEDGSIYDIPDIIRSLAENSDSGKVVLVGHSNGGLLSKKLVNKLNETGDTQLIDQVVLVASPQIGTPQTVPDMLHGRFLINATVREFARSMPSAFHLLPSEEYLERVVDVVGNGQTELDYTALISFDEETLSKLEDDKFNYAALAEYYSNKYGTTTIHTYQMFKDFFLGNDGARTQPVWDDTAHPLQFYDRGQLMEYAENTHDELGSGWTNDINGDGESDFRVVQIAGWGVPETVRGIIYFAKQDGDKCLEYSGDTCIYTEPKWVLDTRPKFAKTYDGDGTVILPSAVAMGEVSDVRGGVETYYVDLFTYNNPGFFVNNIDRKHGGILEVENVQNLIANLISYQNNPTSGLDYLYQSQDELPKNEVNYLRLAMHSPVDVHIYDNKGNHVGVFASTTDEQISNSYYMEFGEGKYLGVPIEDGEKYTVKLEGAGSGIFTFEMSEEHGGVVQTTQTFTHIPVSTTTKSTFILSSLKGVVELTLDHDGDGKIDVVVFTDEYKEEITFNTLRVALKKFSKPILKNLLRQSKNTEKQYNKENYVASKMILFSMDKILEKFLKKHILKFINISKEDVLRAREIISVLLVEVEEKRQEQKENNKNKWKNFKNKSRWK